MYGIVPLVAALSMLLFGLAILCALLASSQSALSKVKVLKIGWHDVRGGLQAHGLMNSNEMIKS